MCVCVYVSGCVRLMCVCMLVCVYLWGFRIAHYTVCLRVCKYRLSNPRLRASWWTCASYCRWAAWWVLVGLPVSSLYLYSIFLAFHAYAACFALVNIGRANTVPSEYVCWDRGPRSSLYVFYIFLAFMLRRWRTRALLSILHFQAFIHADKYTETVKRKWECVVYPHTH